LLFCIVYIQFLRIKTDIKRIGVNTILAPMSSNNETLAHQFDVYLSKYSKDNDHTFAWKASIDKAKFPKVSVHGGGHLDEEKYKSSFQPIFDIFGSLPSQLFDYTVQDTADTIDIFGPTETTVRVAIVDLITGVLPKASVKMVRPPLDFRVYVPSAQTATMTATTEEQLAVPLNIFGNMEGDYYGDY
jgi:hypothetical protein